MATLTRLELSIAYPFMSLAVGIIFLLSFVSFGENYTLGKGLGFCLTMLGVYVSTNF